MAILSDDERQLTCAKTQQPKQQKNLSEVAEEKPSLVRASFHHSSTSSLSCSSGKDNANVVVIGNNASVRHDIQYPSQTSINDSPTLMSIFWEFLCGTFNMRRLSKSNLKWGHKRSSIVGASCLLFLLPVPFLYKYLNFDWTAIGFFLVAITSFCSDYVYTGLDSIFHGIDRVLASMLFLRLVVFAIEKASSSESPSSRVAGEGDGFAADGGNNLWTLAVPIVAITFFLNSVNASRKGNYERYVVWHTLWHVAASGLAVSVSYIFRNAENTS